MRVSMHHSVACVKVVEDDHSREEACAGTGSGTRLGVGVAACANAGAGATSDAGAGAVGRLSLGNTWQASQPRRSPVSLVHGDATILDQRIDLMFVQDAVAVRRETCNVGKVGEAALVEAKFPRADSP